MNPVILTKISKFALIGSLSAYLSFASKHNPLVKQFFYYTLGGVIVAIVIVLLWEGREAITSLEPTEEGLANLLTSASNRKSKRQYFLSNKTRLELVIGLVVISVCTLVGSI